MDTHGYKVHGYRAHGYEHGTGYMGTLEHDKWVGGNMVCEYMGTWLWVKILGWAKILGSGENIRLGRKFWVKVKILGLGENFSLGQKFWKILSPKFNCDHCTK